MNSVLNFKVECQKCPSLRNIDKPATLSFSSAVRGAMVPIFEDGPDFDLAFKLFHVKDRVVPLSGRSTIISNCIPKPDPKPQFNPLAAKAATISLSNFKPEEVFRSSHPSETWKKLENRQEPSMKRHSSSEGDSSKHEALRNGWLETGNCPIAKSYRAVSHVLPLVSTVLQSSTVAARAVITWTALVKNLLTQSLPAKMLRIGVLGMLVVPLFGVVKEHAKMFSSWFAAARAAASYVAMLGKFLAMPTTHMGGRTSSANVGDVSDIDESPIQETTLTEGPSSVTQHTSAGGNALAVGSVAGRGHSIDVGGKASNVSITGKGHTIFIGGSGNTIVLGGRERTFAGIGAADAGPSKQPSKGKGKMIPESAGPSKQSSDHTGRINGANAGPSKKYFKGKGKMIA